MAKDMIERTEGIRKAAEVAIYQAYKRGYKDGEKAEHDRKLEMLLKEKKGKWVTTDDKYIDVCKCSECGAIEYFNKGWKKFDYCPNCGARMEESDEEANASE